MGAYRQFANGVDTANQMALQHRETRCFTSWSKPTRAFLLRYAMVNSFTIVRKAPSSPRTNPCGISSGIYCPLWLVVRPPRSTMQPRLPPVVRAGIVGDVPCLNLRHVECLCTTLNVSGSGMQHVKGHAESNVAIGKLLPRFCTVLAGRG